MFWWEAASLTSTLRACTCSAHNSRCISASETSNCNEVVFLPQLLRSSFYEKRTVRPCGEEALTSSKMKPRSSFNSCQESRYWSMWENVGMSWGWSKL